MARKLDRTSPLLRALTLLEHVVAAEAPLTLAEAATGAGLPKPTAYRMLVMLEDAGLVVREPGGRRVGAGPRLTRLALDTLRQGVSRGPRRAILQSLAASIRETVNLTAIEGSDIVYLDRVESEWPLRVSLQPGSRVPLHCSASGKLLLALMPAPRRKKLFDALPLTRHTAQTIADRRALAREIARIRHARVAVDNEEYIAGLVCVAVPVTLADGRVVASVAVQAPVARMPLATALTHVPALRDAATALAATMDDAPAGRRVGRKTLPRRA